MSDRLAPAALVVAVFAAPLLWTGCGGGSSDPASCKPVAESCNDVDDDCDGETDEADAAGCTTYFEDADGDGAGDASACLCVATAPYTLTTGGDCDDGNPDVFPGATESCNGVDDDCSGVIDQGIDGCCAPTDPAQGCGADQGVCAAGTSSCGPTFGWGPCLDGAGSPVILPGDQVEVCNGLDDDCDGATDEEIPAGAACDGSDEDLCNEGYLVCDLGQFVCSDVTDANAELCNGVDDDCDGATDEGFPGLGGECSVGSGICARQGSTVCTAAGDGTRCSEAPGVPDVEACNGLDDDCDGQTDEADASGCTTYWTDADADGYGAVPAACLCAAAAPFTEADGGDCNDSSAAILPGATERCNATDDDCDANTDEDFKAGGTVTLTDLDGATGLVLGSACGSGRCSGGVVVCGASQVALSCTSHAMARTELCNAVDDDCDGSTDEAPADAWLGQACCATGNLADCANTGSGVRCSTGAQACSSGANVCVGSVAKSAESCNGVDDDCDGSLDDVAGLGTACTGGGVNTTGACTAAYTCGGAPGPGPGGLTCTQLVGPTSESCNGADDDCNGQIDEGFTGLGTSCSVGVGICLRTGTRICDVGGTGTQCSASPGTPVAEVCNWLDDDCDGTTDEGFVELCNGMDDDCDGQTDEGFTGLGTSCSAGIGGCYRSGSRICKTDGTGTQCSVAAGDATAETCNNVDDDCDGQTDEGFTGLGTSCSAGTGVCTRGGWRVCDATGLGTTCNATPAPPGTEACNNLDDDCDGVTDEGSATGCVTFWIDSDGDGYGGNSSACLCTATGGYTAMLGGDCNDTNAAANPSAPERCGNLIDDNCNGQTDEVGCIP